jgi:ATP-dependent 26S proteasome regulatory subunit
MTSFTARVTLIGRKKAAHTNMVYFNDPAVGGVGMIAVVRSAMGLKAAFLVGPGGPDEPRSSEAAPSGTGSAGMAGTTAIALSVARGPPPAPPAPGVLIIGLNQWNRQLISVAIDDAVSVDVMSPKTFLGLVSVNFTVSVFGKLAEEGAEAFSRGALRQKVLTMFSGQPLRLDQKVLVRLHPLKKDKDEAKNLVLQVSDLSLFDASLVTMFSIVKDMAVLANGTKICFVGSSGVHLVDVPEDHEGGGAGGAGAGGVGGFGGGRHVVNYEVFSQSFDKSSLDIGGLDLEFWELIRRAFLPRLFVGAASKLKIQAPVGAVLYGPPGCGKTLIARALAKALVGGGGVDKENRRIKVVNGPALLNAFVGASEKALRDLFKDAADAFALHGEDAEVYIIIFDEIDAICKKRGSGGDGGTGVADNMVTQLLTMLDGVKALRNVFVFGLTNRFDLLDEALLRPGRLEIHIEVGLPTEKGRADILNVHLKRARDLGNLDESVDVRDLASRTLNFTGAELAGLVRNVMSSAMTRVAAGKDFLSADVAKEMESMKLTMEDFEVAIAQSRPQFGTASYMPVMPQKLITDHAPGAYDVFFADLCEAIHRGSRSRASRTGEGVGLGSDPGPGRRTIIMVQGTTGCGKTTAVVGALAELAARGVPLTNQQFVSAGTTFPAGMSGSRKLGALDDVYRAAIKTPEAVVLIENIEAVIGWSSVGSRYDNDVLHYLLDTMMSAPVPTGVSLVIVVTCRSTNLEVLDHLGVSERMDLVLQCPDVSNPAAVFAACQPSLGPLAKYVEDRSAFRTLQSLCQAMGDVEDAWSVDPDKVVAFFCRQCATARVVFNGDV